MMTTPAMDTAMGNNTADIWSVIIGFVDCGSEYKTICLVDRVRRDIARRIYPDADTKFANQLLTLLMKIDYGDFVPPVFNDRDEFVWYIRDNAHIIHAESIPRAFMDLHPDLFSNWAHLTWPNDTTLQWIEDLAIKNPKEACWVWRKAGSHPCVTIDYIKANIDLPWSWTTIAMNKNITPEIIEANPDLPWDIDNILTWNRNVTIDFAEKHTGSRNWQSRAPVSIADVKNNPHHSWKMSALSTNTHISIDDIAANLDLPWSWTDVFEVRKDIRADHIRKYQKIPWDMHHVTKYMRTSEVKANRDIAWCQCNECSVIHDDNYDFSSTGNGRSRYNFARWLLVRPGMTWRKIMSFPIKNKRIWACVFQHALI